MNSASRFMCRPPRGSALVFVIVLLSILAMLGTAYLLIVQQSGKASTNSMTNLQAEMAAQSGMHHAMRDIRIAVMNYQISTPTEVYDPTLGASQPPVFCSPCNPSGLSIPVTTYVSDKQVQSYSASNPSALVNTGLISNPSVAAGMSAVASNPLPLAAGSNVVIDVPGNFWDVGEMVAINGSGNPTSYATIVALVPGTSITVNVLAHSYAATPPTITVIGISPLARFQEGSDGSIPSAVLSGANITATGTTTVGSNILTGLASTAGITVGNTVIGTGLSPGTTVGAVTATTVTLTSNATVANTSSYTFVVDHFTVEPLGIVSNPKDLMQGALSLDMARQAEMDGGSINEFYPTVTKPDPAPPAAKFPRNVKELPHLANNIARGRYNVWIADMDSKFYAVPQDWGIDCENTHDLPVPLGWNIKQNDPLTFNEYAVRQNILYSLRYSSPDFAGIEQCFDTGTILALDKVSVTNSSNDLRFPNYRTNKELSLNMPLTAVVPPPALPSPPGDPAAIADYQLARANQDYYLTVYKDITYPQNSIPLKFAKDWPSAININTAQPEVIAAALSQIPCDSTLRHNSSGTTIGNVPCKDNIMLNIHLANRIVSKRPFLCRMDFEDFLAAQILGTIDNEAGISDSSTKFNPIDDGLGDNQVIPPDSDPMWWSYDISAPNKYYWGDPTHYVSPTTGKSYFPAGVPGTSNPPVTYLIYFSIGRRLGPGNTTFQPGSPWAADSYVSAAFGPTAPKPELTVSQWLEIPGVPDNHPTFFGCNTPAAQKLRFRYFVGTAAERTQVVNVEQSLITAKEFNNILNSVTAIYFPPTGTPQDIQVTAPGTIITFPGPPAVPPTPPTVVQAGDGKQCYTVAQGNDTIDPSGNIVAGPGPIPNSYLASTWTPQYRPSYYSYFNDVALADGFWTALQLTGTPPVAPSVFPTGVTGALNTYAGAHPTSPLAFYNGTPASPGPFGDKTISILDPAFSSVPIASGPYAGQTILQSVTTLEQQSKFFYLYRLSPGHIQDIPGGYPNPIPPSFGLVLPMLTTDLLFWRCRPAVSSSQITNFTDASPVLNTVPTFNGRTGLYQMSFDDWTADGSAPPTWNLGVIQATGDPQARASGTYSSAMAPTSIIPHVPATTPPSWDWVCGYNDGSGLHLNGDVNWSPQFCFRSRFFGIYVLARGLAPNATLGERRIEAVYDALKDEILWQRSPVSEKKSLGDP